MNYSTIVGKHGIYLVDHGRGRSITNAAEYVVMDVIRLHGYLPIYYKDTDGQWDELIHEDGEFKDFGFGVPPEAVKEMKELGLLA